MQIPYFKAQKTATPSINFTIVVPARNEEEHIENCLSSLVNQTYSTAHTEIIVINDHSTDATQHVVEQFIQKHETHRVKLINMHELAGERMLKKAAITHAIGEASGEYIILTDADCTRGKKWLETIAAFIQEKQAKMVYGPVEFTANSVFERIQSLEFAGLVGIGASAIQLKNPNMCSAANLIFERNVFFEVDGYTGNDGLASGDDEFLLHKVFKRYPSRIHFLKHRDAIVYTTPSASVKQLTEQRKRWVSKSTKYENRYITAILVAAYVFNASILWFLITQPWFGLKLVAIKALTEGLFLYSVLAFFKRKSYLLLLPIAEVFHIIYVLIIGILGNVGTYTWKERKLK
jgi:glycosyltransferase involved in cell wall biosynthesis